MISHVSPVIQYLRHFCEMPVSLCQLKYEFGPHECATSPNVVGRRIVRHPGNWSSEPASDVSDDIRGN